MSFCWFVCLSVCLPLLCPFYLPVCWLGGLSASLSVGLSASLSVVLPACLPACAVSGLLSKCNVSHYKLQNMSLLNNAHIRCHHHYAEMHSCLDQIPGVQVRGTQSVVDCLLEYSTKHKAGLIIMGSQQVLPLSRAPLPLASLPP